jgi:sugar phosphate isomerase/epimerase
MSRSLSLSYYTVPELTLPETIDVAADAGCDLVGIRVLDGAPTDPPSALMRDVALRRASIARMQDRGIQALDASAARLRSDTRAAAFGPMLDVCAELGVRHVDCSIDDPDPSRRVQSVAMLCELAAQRDLRVEIEFVPWLAIATVAQAAALVRETGATNLGILVDALHLDRSGGHPDELRSLPPAWLRVAQLCDAPACTDFSVADQIRVATKARCLPGEGVLPLTALVRALPRDIPLALEIPMQQRALHMPAVERVKAAVAASRRMIEEAEGVLQ